MRYSELFGRFIELSPFFDTVYDTIFNENKYGDLKLPGKQLIYAEQV